MKEVIKSKNQRSKNQPFPALPLRPMRLYPDTALTQLEFDKVRALLEGHCKTLYAKQKACLVMQKAKRRLKLVREKTNISQA